MLAPSKSRNFSRESRCRLRTCSSSIIAMCAAGPPKAVVPSRRKNKASSSRGTCLFSEIDSGDSRAGCSAMSCAPSFCQPCVKRPRASTNRQQKDETEQHAQIRASFMQRSPKPVFRKRDDFGRIQGDGDINKSGTVASRVIRPINSREPQTISTTPTNGAITCGQGMPIFTNRPTPNESGKRNF